CSQCRNQGTTGRTVVAEIVLPDEQFFKYVRAGEKGEAAQYWLHELGGRTMLEHVIEKVEEGIVDPRMAEKAVGHLTMGTHRAGKAPVSWGAIHAA
ncbi:MAG: secretion system protein E, partial [Noviherbaspirillum sp.]